MDALIELNELRDAVRRVLAGQVDRLAMLRDPGIVPEVNRLLWNVIAEQGWPGLAVPEARGGLGQPFSALAVLYTELGRALVGNGFGESLIGLDVLSHGDAAATAAAVLDAALAGDAVVMLAGTEPDVWRVTDVGDSIAIDGTGPLLLGAERATHLLLPMRLHGEVAVALLALPQAGITLEGRATWDVTRGQAHTMSLSNLAVTPSNIVLRGDAAEHALERARTHADLALACDAVGGADQILTETLAYMETRKQFNRVIASFQALKHRCADLKTSIEAARGLVDATCQAFSGEQGEWRTAAAGARLYAGLVYRQVSEDAVQLHGGIGFTWEQCCHLFLKRARLNELIGGTVEQRKDAAAVVMLRAAARRCGSLLSEKTPA